jgi:hypothetical protein
MARRPADAGDGPPVCGRVEGFRELQMVVRDTPGGEGYVPAGQGIVTLRDGSGPISDQVVVRLAGTSERPRRSWFVLVAR